MEYEIIYVVKCFNDSVNINTIIDNINIFNTYNNIFIIINTSYEYYNTNCLSDIETKNKHIHFIQSKKTKSKFSCLCGLHLYNSMNYIIDNKFQYQYICCFNDSERFVRQFKVKDIKLKKYEVNVKTPISNKWYWKTNLLKYKEFLIFCDQYKITPIASQYNGLLFDNTTVNDILPYLMKIEKDNILNTDIELPIDEILYPSLIHFTNNTYTNICKIIWDKNYNINNEFNSILDDKCDTYYSIKFSQINNVNEYNKIIYDLQNHEKIAQKDLVPLVNN